MAKTNFKSVSEYIESKPKEIRTVLKQVRATIRKAVPKAEELISYQIPAYKLDGTFLMFFAGWKEHFSLYPARDELVAEFKDELSRYKITKGTIQFPLDEPVPVKLIERIAKVRAKQLMAPMKVKSGKKTSRAAQLERIRRICNTMPSVAEKLSHGEPTFFVQKDKGVFAMFANNHHDDGHMAVWLPAREGMQSVLIEEAPKTYFRPPYVGVSGWIGIELTEVGDEALAIHIREAWELSAAAKKKKR